MNDWRDNAPDQWLDAGDPANQIGMTPLRDYAMQAGGMLGIDPNLVAGWYPEASQIGDFQDQRDLEALNATGMTYDEYQRALSQFDQQNQDMAGQYQDAYDQQMADDVMNTYQVDIGAWATAPNCSPTSCTRSSTPTRSCSWTIRSGRRWRQEAWIKHG